MYNKYITSDTLFLSEFSEDEAKLMDEMKLNLLIIYVIQI